MADMPDDPDKLGEEAGEPISQDALDALLANTENGAEIDDSNVLGALMPEDSGQFGVDDAETEEEAGLGEGLGFGEGEEAHTPFGGFGGGMGDIDLDSFDMPVASSPMPSETEDPGFMRVRDIPLDITVELGRTRLLIRDILDLSTGAIIELDKIAGEPVDLFANGLLVARGEVIVIDDNFGVRVTEIITAEERLKAEYEHSLAA